jgi:high-affinity nickel-transport protein
LKRRAASEALNSVSGKVSLKQLLVLGITGGMLPCPAALVVMLSAVSLRRTGFGLFLIVAFSTGLAAVLIAVGLAMVYTRRWIGSWSSESRLLQKWLPVTSATFITILGCVLGFRGLAAMHLQNLFPAAGWSAFLLTVALGFVLGIRHSTDPDHVVAVSTIVSRQPSVRKGALIGAVWGIGHTLTIFVVGSAIILFRVSIPVRLGLGMEFLVAVMLILLGVLNLTGLSSRLRIKLRGANSEQLRQPAKSPTSRHIFVRSLAVGIVHGLAGSAAVALLVLATIPSPGWAVCYLLVFGLGTIAGMTLMTSAISLPLSVRGFDQVGSYVSVCSGIVSMAFGGFLVYQIGYVGGLFAAHPIWTPR